MMSERLRHLVVPIFTVLCLVLGGSAQGVWGNLLLQMCAIALLAWAALTRTPSVSSRDARALGWIILATGIVIVLQLVPLPPALWTALPGREPIAAGYRLLGEDLPWLPVSLTPHLTVSAALSLLPPVAIIAGIVRLGAYRSSWLALAIVLATIAGVALGAVQVTADRAYLYRFTSHGQAAGFFANANYMGTLLLVAIPFIAALFVRARANGGRSHQRRAGIVGLAGGALAVVLLGLALNSSMAAALLSLPVLLASAMLLLKPSRAVRPWLIGSAVVLAVGGCVALATVPALANGEATVSVAARQDIYQRSLKATADMFPVGAGIGSFATLYPRYEDPDAVDWIFVNHVHNDYLELVLEAGLAGLLLVVAFLYWWVRRCVQIWRSAVSGSFARAATIASAAILAHSLVDFPVRTTAIAAVFAAAIALMAEPRSRRAQPEAEVRSRPARHLSLP